MRQIVTLLAFCTTLIFMWHRSTYEALQRAGLINPDWLLYLMLAYASRVFIREKREKQPVYIYPSSIITRARAWGLRGFAGSSNGVKNSRPLKQKADGKVTAWIFLPTMKGPHSSVWWPLLNARMQWLGYQPRTFSRKAVHILFNV